MGHKWNTIAQEFENVLRYIRESGDGNTADRIGLTNKLLVLLGTEQHETGRYDKASQVSKIVERWTVDYMYVLREECLAELASIKF